MKIVTIGGIFIAAIFLLTLSVVTTAAQEKVRFETDFNVETQDAVELKIRVFGFWTRGIDIRAQKTIFLDNVRSKFAETVFEDVPDDLREMFHEELERAEDEGIDVDSVSWTRVN